MKNYKKTTVGMVTAAVAVAVSKIAQNLSYPKGYSYSSIELQTDTEPYELIVF